ncbi:MAG TPA: TVP38/TMEM64 family protein [Syntrophorhabdaceae bacterium]|nr:TVP38/TMEM64 family protein [Syntrophorhabdaceae bacterium]
MQKAGLIRVIVTVLIFIGIIYTWSISRNYITFEKIIMHKDALRQAVDQSYVVSVAIFMLVFISTAFFIPGALVLSLLSGFLFGTAAGALYTNISASIGAALSFLAARYIFGNWVQRKYSDRLSAFNREITRHGNRYLFSLRVAPIMPFFLVNALAGMTKMRFRNFLFITFAGVLPGSVIYANAGRQMGMIEDTRDIMSPRVVLSIALLLIVVLTPVVVHHTLQHYGRRSSRR